MSTAPAALRPPLRIVVDTNLLLDGKRVRRSVSTWTRCGLLVPVWSPTLVGELMRKMTEYEMLLAFTGQARRDKIVWRDAVTTMFEHMERDYEVARCLPEPRTPRHVRRNPKDAHVWWTAVVGKARFIVTNDPSSAPRPSDFDRADDLHGIEYINFDELERSVLSLLPPAQSV